MDSFEVNAKGRRRVFVDNSRAFALPGRWKALEGALQDAEERIESVGVVEFGEAIQVLLRGVSKPVIWRNAGDASGFRAALAKAAD